MGTKLFFWFVGTIAVSCGFLFVYPITSPTVGGFHLHHWMYGAAITMLAWRMRSLATFGIGLGLFVDEITFIIRTCLGKSSLPYYSWQALVGIVVCAAIVFVLKDALAAQFFNTANRHTVPKARDL
ncbi:MAG: hypothetical protein JO026_01370 [Patescibacteria group bacterium]|nr:hypothetical protein [Patescibacteria group bacterium]